MRLLELLDTYFPRFVTEYSYLDSETGEPISAMEIATTMPDKFIVLQFRYFNLFSYAVGLTSTTFNCDAIEPRS